MGGGDGYKVPVLVAILAQGWGSQAQEPTEISLFRSPPNIPFRDGYACIG